MAQPGQKLAQVFEGGGTFNGALLQLGLVDDVSQVIAPVIDGGRGVPGLFDIPGPLPSKAVGTLQPIKHPEASTGTAIVLSDGVRSDRARSAPYFAASHSKQQATRQSCGPSHSPPGPTTSQTVVNR